ncbi:MAG: hypothetical protein FGM27_05680 [Candidatus Omnitrophica bacterium]|nr:hypothetical protein [Candidatus Omnitrophota bacterium]
MIWRRDLKFFSFPLRSSPPSRADSFSPDKGPLAKLSGLPYNPPVASLTHEPEVMMKKLKYWICGFLLPICASGSLYSEELPPMPEGPLLLTSAVPEMLNPDYWIDRLPEPDKVIKTPEQLKKFNKEIRAFLPEQRDIFTMETSRSGAGIAADLKNVFSAVRGRKLLFEDDAPVPKSFFDERVKPVMAAEKVPERIQYRWGAAVRAASVRSLPTDVKLLEKPGDIEFDMLQYTQIKLWTPLAIYHASPDGEWLYIQAPYTRGWVRSRDIAVFSSREVLKQYVETPKFLVVTGESVPLYRDASMTRASLRASMGTLLPLVSVSESAYVIEVPVRQDGGKASAVKAYITIGSDVTRGFPAYTQRNIIRQAFKLLGARYGWGGMYNGRDCSGFTHDVFLSMGVDMPRDSKQQGFVGTQLGHFKIFDDAEYKATILRSATPGLTLLRMPMHLMFYLGEVGDNFYVIHSTWAERYSMTSDDKNRINQVVVSDLSLNGRSRIGSLFDRILSANEVN